MDEELVDRRVARAEIVEIVTLEYQRLGRLQGGHRCRAFRIRTEQRLLSESIAGSQDLERGRVARGRQDRDLHVAPVDQVKAPPWVTLMEQHLVAGELPPGGGREHPPLLVVRELLQCREPGHLAPRRP